MVAKPLLMHIIQSFVSRTVTFAVHHINLWENQSKIHKTAKKVINHLNAMATQAKESVEAFSSPEAAILLVSTKNRDLWVVPILKHAQKSLSIILSQSDLSDLTMSPWVLGVARGLDSWCWPEGSRPLGTRMVLKGLNYGWCLRTGNQQTRVQVEHLSTDVGKKNTTMFCGKDTFFNFLY